MQGYSYDKSSINARLKDLSERDRVAVLEFDRLYWNKLWETAQQVQDVLDAQGAPVATWYKPALTARL